MKIMSGLTGSFRVLPQPILRRWLDPVTAAVPLVLAKDAAVRRGLLPTSVAPLIDQNTEGW